jgi:phospholipase D1/2
MSSLDHAKNTFAIFAGDVRKELGEIEESLEAEKHSHTHLGEACHKLHPFTHENRFHSFAPPRTGNDAKWFVDGCGYMWAVSVAIEEAKESIWILDWWLSPELYLRRPPSDNESYRIDRMLLAAAERGVKVNIIVYKEVAAVLTREFIVHLRPI